MAEPNRSVRYNQWLMRCWLACVGSCTAAAATVGPSGGGDLGWFELSLVGVVGFALMGIQRTLWFGGKHSDPPIKDPPEWRI